METTEYYHPYKPLELELYDPENNKHRAQFYRENDFVNDRGGVTCGEYKLLVSPSLCDKDFNFVDPYDDEEEIELSHNEFAVDMSEWIGAAIIEGHETEGVYDSFPNVSFRVLNPEDMGEDEALTYMIFGSMLDIGEITPKEQGLGPDLSGLGDKFVVTSDPLLITMMTAKFNNLYNLSVLDTEQDPVLRELSTLSFNKQMLKGALISHCLERHLDYNDTASKNILPDIAKLLSVTDSKTLNQFSLLSNESREAPKWISRINDSIDDNSFPQLNEEANEYAKKMNIKIVNPDEVLSNLPLVEIGTSLLVEKRKINGVDCDVYTAQPEYEDDYLLGVATPNDKGKVLLQTGPYLERALSFDTPENTFENTNTLSNKLR